jgi:hypothetical protein
MHTDATTTPTTSSPRYSADGLKLFMDLDGENPPEEAGTPITESVAWGRVVSASRKWDSAAALAEYLAAQFQFWTSRAPTVNERLALTRQANTIWANALSERVVPTHPPEGMRFAVCAWAPCRRTFPEGTGFGTLCSRQCFVDEAEAGTVALGDDDDAAGIA